MKFKGLGHLFKSIPEKYKPVALGAVVAVPLGLFLLIHKTKPNTSGASTTTPGASGTLSYRGTGIPVGGPEHTQYTTITKYVPTTAGAKKALTVGWWEGYVARIQKRLRWTNTWITQAERSKNRNWLTKELAQKKGLEAELHWGRWNVARAKAGKSTSAEPGAPGKH